MQIRSIKVSLVYNRIHYGEVRDGVRGSKEIREREKAMHFPKQKFRSRTLGVSEIYEWKGIMN